MMMLKNVLVSNAAILASGTANRGIISPDVWYRILPEVFNMSMTAAIIIVAVLFVRLILKRAPKIFSYMLWSVVLFRLLCPVSVESPVSVLNLFNVPVTESGRFEYVPENIVHEEFPEVAIPIPGVSEVINEKLPQGSEQLVADPLEFPVSSATYIWMLGILAMVAYSGVQYLKLRRKLAGAVPMTSVAAMPGAAAMSGTAAVTKGRDDSERDISDAIRHNIFLADHIGSPFVMGFFRPKIYLPSNLTKKEQSYIIAHEQHHIRRLDHVVKILAFAALCIHWFNPLVWVAFVLSGRDMEMSCDEAVMRKMKEDIRGEYSTSLLNLATGRRILVGAPLAFGEGDTKSRIKNVMLYKKPAFWAMIAGICVICAAGAFLFTNPVSEQSDFYRWTSSINESDLTNAKALEVHRFYGESTIYYELTEEDIQELVSIFNAMDRDKVIIGEYGDSLSEYRLILQLEEGTYAFRYNPLYPNMVSLLWPDEETRAEYGAKEEENVWLESPELVGFILDRIGFQSGDAEVSLQVTQTIPVEEEDSAQKAVGSSIITPAHEGDNRTIAKILKLFANAKQKTGIFFEDAYVNMYDFPRVEEYIQIEIRSNDVTGNYCYGYFIYQVDGEWRLDTPYNAMYTLEDEVAEKIILLLEEKQLLLDQVLLLSAWQTQRM